MATPTLAQARSHYARQSTIVAAAVLAIRSLFRRRRPLVEIASTVSAYQYASAAASANTVATWADAQAALTVPQAFQGVSSLGFPIIEPIIATIDQHVPAPPEALPDAWWKDAAAFMADIEQLIASEVADAGRSASQTEMAARPDWQNYVRMLTPPSCDRCAILAGRIYRDLEAFQRHPGCFPAGTVVSGPAASRATRRWYEGELVIIRTAGGKELSATGNHPILTDQGWLPANLLTEGSHVVSRASGDRSRALLVPDHDQVPARIEDVWGSAGVRPLGRVPVAPEDFHGDGLGSGHVDVVLPNGALRDRREVALLEQLRQVALPGGVELASLFDPSRAGFQFGDGALALPGGGLSGLDLGSPLAWQHPGGTQQAGLGWMANRDLPLDQAAPDDHATDARSLGDGVLALATQVGGHDRLGVDLNPSSTRWDAPAEAFSVENRGSYAARGQDLSEWLAGQVELDRVVELRRVSFAGHVYNLTSSEGWYDAEGIIVSNCDCVMVPVQDWQDAHDKGLVSSFADAFERGEVRGLSEADAKAIRDGADPDRVINAKRGTGVPGITNAYRTELFGHRVKATHDSTTRRSAWRKANPTRLVRLRPESIYEIAKDHEDAIRLLRLYGYIK